MSVAIKVNIRDIDRLFLSMRRLERRFADLRPLLKFIGEMGSGKAKEYITKGETPYGEKYKELSEVTKKRRKGNQPKPLMDTGRLRSSITYQTSEDEVRIGSNVIYAGVHQRGADIPVTERMRRYLHVTGLIHLRQETTEIHIPARPYLPDRGLPEDWIEEIRGFIGEMLNDHRSRG